MDSIKRDIKREIVIEKVNLVRATLNEAYLMKDNLLEDGLDYKKIIVDLSSCDYIDSTFLGALIKEQDGEILLVIGNHGLTNSFIFREISSIFKVCNSIREAIEELNNHRSEILSDKS